jgi:hypothetical protein
MIMRSLEDNMVETKMEEITFQWIVEQRAVRKIYPVRGAQVWITYHCGTSIIASLPLLSAITCKEVPLLRRRLYLGGAAEGRIYLCGAHVMAWDEVAIQESAFIRTHRFKAVASGPLTVGSVKRGLVITGSLQPYRGVEDIIALDSGTIPTKDEPMVGNMRISPNKALSPWGRPLATSRGKWQ